MPRYHYRAVEASTGRIQRGLIERATSDAAVQALKDTGLHPTELVPEEESNRAPTTAKGARLARGLSRRRPGVPVIAVFTRQLATLLKARLPLVRALDVLARQERHPRLRLAVAALAERVREGGALSEAFAQHPRIFPPVYVNMTRAGEASGALAEVLGRLAGFLEKQARLQRRIRAAMTYPLVIMTVAALIVGSLMVFVIPRFELIFRSLLKGQPMPPLTRVVVGASRFVQEHVVLTVLMVLAALAGIALLRRFPKVMHLRDWLSLRLPVVGDLGLKSSVARFSRTWGTLLVSGVPILEALRITRDTSGNRLIAGALQRVHTEVEAGQGVAEPLERTGLFPPMVTSMVAVGEETGGLPEMLNRVAEIYEDEVDQAVGALTALLEPLMIVVMAVVVGTIVVAMFLPIIRIIQLLS